MHNLVGERPEARKNVLHISTAWFQILDNPQRIGTYIFLSTRKRYIDVYLDRSGAKSQS